jgi:hypothetical protein
VGSYRNSAHRARQIILPSPHWIECDVGKRRKCPKRLRTVSVHSAWIPVDKQIILNVLRSHATQAEHMPISPAVEQLLSEPLFRESGASYDQRELIKAANNIGPPMKLLHWRKLEELRYLPAFAACHADDALSGVERFGAPEVEIFMVSHRWLRPSVTRTLAHPDDALATKAQALTEFSHWRRSWVRQRHRFLPELYYWIDYCCFDQLNLAANMAMLPLWVACCERLVCFETSDYHSRAWCRLELLLSHSFNFADHHTVIGPGFRASDAHNGLEENHILQRPGDAELTDAADRVHIQPLEQLACQFSPASVDRISGSRLPPARFGQTLVRRYRL